MHGILDGSWVLPLEQAFACFAKTGDYLAIKIPGNGEGIQFRAASPTKSYELMINIRSSSFRSFKVEPNDGRVTSIVSVRAIWSIFKNKIRQQLNNNQVAKPGLTTFTKPNTINDLLEVVHLSRLDSNQRDNTEPSIYVKFCYSSGKTKEYFLKYEERSMMIASFDFQLAQNLALADPAILKFALDHLGSAASATANASKVVRFETNENTILFYTVDNSVSDQRKVSSCVTLSPVSFEKLVVKLNKNESGFAAPFQVFRAFAAIAVNLFCSRIKILFSKHDKPAMFSATADFMNVPSCIDLQLLVAAAAFNHEPFEEVIQDALPLYEAPAHVRNTSIQQARDQRELIVSNIQYGNGLNANETEEQNCSQDDNEEEEPTVVWSRNINHSLTIDQDDNEQDDEEEIGATPMIGLAKGIFD